jgi:hypothetical protein
MTKSLEIQNSPALTYPLASGDMRYIEIGERQLFLRNDPQKGLVFRGEISGCGADCYAELNEILLEYAMSCEGCKEQGEAETQVVHFGEKLAKILIAELNHDITQLSAEENLSNAFRCILNSMSSAYIEEISEAHLMYSIECCPLTECAINTGFSRSVEMAYLSFVALCESIIQDFASNWELLQPSSEEADIPIHRILITRS